MDTEAFLGMVCMRCCSLSNLNKTGFNINSVFPVPMQNIFSHVLFIPI